ncbi:MAG: hypothetical protein ACOCX2_04895 [Armatimonadota bacterium]
MRNAVIVLALLAAVAVVNYLGGPRTDPAQSVSESEQHAAAMDAPMEMPEGEEHAVTQPELEPFGSDDAVVKLEVFYEEENDCQGGISADACNLAQRYQPHVQTQLRPWNAEGTKERAEELEAHCLVVIAVSTRDSDGTWGPAKIEFISPPGTGDWSWGDLEGLVATKLAETGVEITPAELLTRSMAPAEGTNEADAGPADAAQ